MVLNLRNIFIGDQTHQLTLIVHDGQFLDLRAQEHIFGILQVGRVGRHELIARSHHIANEAIHVALEAQVAVRHDTDQNLILIDHRNTADLIFVHQLQRIAHRSLLRDGHRIVDHTILGTLHATHMSRLLGDRHILVDHTDTALTRQSDGQRGLRHGIHSGRDDRDIQHDISRETSLRRNLSRQHFGIGRNEQHVVESQAFGLHSFIDKRHNERVFVACKSSHFFGIYLIYNSPTAKKI